MTATERLALAEHALEVATTLLAEAEALSRIVAAIDVIDGQHIAVRAAKSVREAATRAEFAARSLAATLKRSLNGDR
jgi:hypothetical protein